MTIENWHHLTQEQILKSNILNLLETRTDSGLHPLEVQNRLARYGLNALTQKEEKKPLTIFLEQFNQPLVYILMAAGVMTGLLKEWVDMGVIFAVVLLNAIVGFIQEAKATQAMEALAKTMQSEATVIRGGQKQRIPATDLVLGDIVVLQSGDKVPADLRLVSSRDLQIAESTLTGESVPVGKYPAEQLPEDTVPTCKVCRDGKKIGQNVNIASILKLSSEKTKDELIATGKSSKEQFLKSLG